VPPNPMIHSAITRPRTCGVRWFCSNVYTDVMVAK
jgi:hypothetical protein